ncbi:MAG: hypothetical protein AB1410_04890 [Acidobacteriota bacterium]
MKSFIKFPQFSSSVLIILLASSFSLFLISCKKKEPPKPLKKLKEAYRIHGKILHFDKGLEATRVYLSNEGSKFLTTDSKGYYNFLIDEEEIKSSYTLTPSKLRYTFSPPNVDLSIQVGIRKDYIVNFDATEAIVGTGIDYIAPNFILYDQKDREISLWDFHGKVVLIYFSSGADLNLGEISNQLKFLDNLYKGKGFFPVLVLISGNPRKTAETFKLDFPVLDDNEKKAWNLYKEGTSNIIPFFFLLDRNLNIKLKGALFYNYQFSLIEKYL